MMKRFNYTGRKKIRRDDIKISLHGEFSDRPVIDVAINLEGYDFPRHASVYIEPQQKTRFMRIGLGNALVEVRRNNVALSEFDDAENLDFRIKIVDESQRQGLLLGLSENIKSRDKDNRLDDNQRSILPVSSVDLSSYGVLWRVEWADEQVTLQVERALGNRDQVVRSLIFKSLILPSAMRQILVRIVSESWDVELDDPGELATRWILFAQQIGAGTPDPDSNFEEHDEWVDDAVRLLVGRIGNRDEIIKEIAEGELR